MLIEQSETIAKYEKDKKDLENKNELKLKDLQDKIDNMEQNKKLWDVQLEST